MIKSWIPSFGKPNKETRYGDAQVFIDTKNDICFIIDGGDGECASRLISYLKKNNIRKVYLLLTHPHSDHGDGLRKIIKDSYFTVLCFYCYDPDSLKVGLRNNRGSDSVREDIDYLNRMISEAKSRNIKVEYLKHGDKIQLGDIKFNVYREQPSRVEDSDTYGWAYVNDGSLCLYFPDLYYWTSGDGSDRIWDFIKKLGLTVKFFKIPHHGNNCPQSQANGLKSHGANLCWYNDLEPNGIGTTDFTAYGARRCKEAGITVINCIGADIEISFAMGKATITKGTSSWTYNILYKGEYIECWIKNAKGWWYRYTDGSWAVGWKKLKWSKGESTFYFNKDGYMVTGWQYLKWDKGYSWFFFDKTNGNMRTGWVYDNNNWYYLNPTDGYMQTGWLDYKNRKCYLEPVSGKNQGHAYRSVTVTIDGETWQFNDNCYGTKITGTTAFTKRTVIDISQFNNVTNWSAVKATGYPVIIRIGYRGSKTGTITYDPKYKEYRSACEKYGIEHGFYFFPCSITDAEAHEEALFIKNEVIKSGMAMPVFLDSEVVQRDKSGRSDNLSKEKRTRMLKIICDDLLKWDIPVGIYASRSWLYNNLDMSQFVTEANDNTWVAEYGVDATKYTGIYVMWQYTSKGFVNGISGNVDMSYQYRPFHLVKTSTSQSVIASTEPVKIEKSELEKVIEVAKGEIGYLEKRSNSQLDDKTANAGDRNFVKYWSVKPEWNGAYWCAAFICWVFTEALGKQRAKELLKHYPYVYCPTLAGLFTKYSTPQVGDIVIFWKNGAYAHTGLVIAVSGNTFTTIEGNTSGASSVVPNGGGVCQKTYNLKDVNAKFCRPAYSSTAITSDANKVVVSDDMHSVKWKGYVNIGRNTKLAVRLQPNISAKECSFSGLKQGTEVGVAYEQGDWYLIKYDGKFGYVQKQYISKTQISEVSNPDPVTDDIHTVKWTGIVNTNGGTLNVRLQPNSSAKTCSFSPLRKGVEVGVCSQSGDWYLIKYDGKYGYVYSSYIKRK